MATVGVFFLLSRKINKLLLAEQSPYWLGSLASVSFSLFSTVDVVSFTALGNNLF